MKIQNIVIYNIIKKQNKFSFQLNKQISNVAKDASSRRPKALSRFLALSLDSSRQIGNSLPILDIFQFQ